MYWFDMLMYFVWSDIPLLKYVWAFFREETFKRDLSAAFFSHKGKCLNFNIGSKVQVSRSLQGCKMSLNSTFILKSTQVIGY